MSQDATMHALMRVCEHVHTVSEHQFTLGCKQCANIIRAENVRVIVARLAADVQRFLLPVLRIKLRHRCRVHQPCETLTGVRSGAVCLCACQSATRMPITKCQNYTPLACGVCGSLLRPLVLFFFCFSLPWAALIDVLGCLLRFISAHVAATVRLLQKTHTPPCRSL